MVGGPSDDGGGHRHVPAATAAAAAVLGGIAALASGSEGGGGWLGAMLLPPALLAITAATMLGILWGWEVAARLERARRLSAELAVKDERLRFAADLHDIQGHHLQVIALKSELAARLAQTDPARAAVEMQQVQRLSTAALRAARTGASVNEIAAPVHLAPGTVRNYLSAAMAKLGVSSRHAAAHRAWEQGWI
jgi:DNA-binding CsgD family transcriptional regulator